MKNSVKIIYCTQCKWLLRATWMSQEILSTFNEEVNELILVPGTGGIFEIYANDEKIWSRKEMNGFPEITTLKIKVRDVIAPNKNLGHIDRKAN
ncbi:SelT/SelW/SelH family protein [Neotamlana laminarinivorans]|uniref:SelT/SelW/SelH family protein n=1 Tax=Neotamlana laminarinivorans TaxID=2883124 RepID=A0A9X1I0B1_9FLAO|nr:SelT/SelW/SelH family protein [Tamlana laminarinivorans]MCB4798243.1 SelT/SelW/SelH family protein [Tamlana laminarinivorans]